MFRESRMSAMYDADINQDLDNVFNSLFNLIGQGLIIGDDNKYLVA